MADSNLFTHGCQQLERESSLGQLEARGTVRLALKQAGLAPATVSTDEMRLVLTKILPGKLDDRGIARAESLCTRSAPGLAAIPSEPQADSPAAVFARLGGSSG